MCVRACARFEEGLQKHLAAFAEIERRVDRHANGDGHHGQGEQPDEDCSAGVVAAPVLVPMSRDACSRIRYRNQNHW